MIQFLNLLCLIFAFLVVPTAGVVAASSDQLLNSPGKRAAPITALPQWQRILQNHPRQITQTQSPQYREWQQFISSIQGEPKLRQMLKVNQWFRKYNYKLDAHVFGEDDYWATPVEFLQRGGDCEDYAIIKYMTLRQLGFAPNDMKVAMVYDVYSGTDHSFLIVNHDGAEFVMDNREKVSVSRYMKKRYKMHFAFNEYTLWTYTKPVMASKVRNQDSAILPGNR